jgi:hypothetical protein
MIRLVIQMIAVAVIISACGSGSHGISAPVASTARTQDTLFRLSVTGGNVFSPGVSDVEWYDVASGDFRAEVVRGRLVVWTVVGGRRAVLTLPGGSEVVAGGGSYLRLHAQPSLTFSPAALAFAEFRHSLRWDSPGLTVQRLARPGSLTLSVTGATTGSDGRRVHYTVSVEPVADHGTEAEARLFNTQVTHVTAVARSVAVGTVPLHGVRGYWLGRRVLGLTARSATEEWSAPLSGRPETDIYRTSYRSSTPDASYPLGIVSVTSQQSPVAYPVGQKRMIVTLQGERATVWTTKAGPYTVEIGTAVLDLSGVAPSAQLETAKRLRRL